MEIKMKKNIFMFVAMFFMLGGVCGFAFTSGAEEKSVTITPTMVTNVHTSPTENFITYPATNELDYKYTFKFTLAEPSEVRITGLSRYTFWNWNGNSYYTLTDNQNDLVASYLEKWETHLNADHPLVDKAGNSCDKFFTLKKGTHYLTVTTKLAEDALTATYQDHNITDFPLGFWLNINVSTYVQKPMIKSCKNIKGKKLNVSIKKIVADGYEIQYSTIKTFKNKKSLRTTTLNNTIKALSKNKKYFVRVRAYRNSDNSKLYGSWSNVKNIKIKK